jgi:hypothetical protein
MPAPRKYDWDRLVPRIQQRMAEGKSERTACQEVGVKRSAYQMHRKAMDGTRDTAPVQTPVQTTDTGAVQSVDTGAVQRLDRLEDDVQGLRQLMQAVIDRLDHPPVQTPVQITALPPYPKGKAVRWNIWILDAIQDEIKTLAVEREMSPSQLVQELLWKALNGRSASMP